MTRARTFLPLLALLALPACGNIQRLAEVGRNPAMQPITDPTAAATWRPISMPMPAPQDAPPEANALWRPGARAFFKDQRASHVGDLVTVLVNITDSANMKNQTSAVRNGAQTMGVPNLFGLEASLPKMIVSSINPSSLVSINSTGNNGGTAAIQRNETITLRLAGTITQVLPNGNMVVVGTQEVRVNGELRKLGVQGVIRPQDIASDNTISSDRLAEARIIYGGRGTMTDVQTPRLGQQLLDILLPF